MAARNSFDIGKILSRGAEVVTGNLPLFLAVSIPLTGIPAFLAYWWQNQYMTGLDPAEIFALVQSPEFLQPMGLVWLVSVFTGAVVHAALTHATIKSLSGQSPELGGALEAGFARMLPVILVSLIIGICVGLGLVLLIVPGIILWLRWSMAIPVVIQERLGPIEELKRSVALTRDQRGNIFLLMLVLIVCLWIFGAVVGFVGVLFTSESPVAQALVQTLIGTVGAMVTVAVTATAYVELRNAKEGGISSELETVFN
jgi:hypothetical protein